MLTLSLIRSEIFGAFQTGGHLLYHAGDALYQTAVCQKIKGVASYAMDGIDYLHPEWAKNRKFAFLEGAGAMTLYRLYQHNKHNNMPELMERLAEIAEQDTRPKVKAFSKDANTGKNYAENIRNQMQVFIDLQNEIDNQK